MEVPETDAFAGRNGKIVFTSAGDELPGGDDPDDREVFTMNSNGAGVKRLTNNLDARDASPNEHRRPYAHPSLPSRGDLEAAFAVYRCPRQRTRPGGERTSPTWARSENERPASPLRPDVPRPTRWTPGRRG